MEFHLLREVKQVLVSAPVLGSTFFVTGVTVSKSTRLCISCFHYLYCMRQHFLFLLLFISLHANAQDNKVEILHYPLTTFNADTCCWRLMDKQGDYDGAAALIESYLVVNGHEVNVHALNWHAGQMFAKAGDYSKAKKYMRKTYSIWYRFANRRAKAWYYYASGTVAFLNGNHGKVNSILKRWKKDNDDDKNYKQLQLLANNPGKTYAEALR